jgi:hypothetical protein
MIILPPPFPIGQPSSLIEVINKMQPPPAALIFPEIIKSDRAEFLQKIIIHTA